MYLAGDLSPPPSPTLPSSAAPPTATTVAARCSLHLPTDNPQLTCTCSRVDPNKLQKHQKPHAHFFTRPEKLPRACYLSRLRLCVALHCIARSVIGSESGMAAMAGGSKPLRLKDLLELDCESCSAAGFRCYPRRLCVAGGAAEAAAPPMRHRLVADRSSSAMRRPKLSSLSKSLSRRLRGGFWRRREEEDEEAAAAAAAPPATASSTAPAVASCCSSSSDSETSESSNSTGGRKSRSHSDYSEISSASSDDSLHAAGEPSTTGADHEVINHSINLTSLLLNHSLTHSLTLMRNQ